MRVLLVEDEDQVAGLTQRELEREYGHKVTLAGDPETAARHLGEQTFDVVVVDILFHQLLQDFERRRLARQVTPGSERLLSSGLAVIQLARKPSLHPKLRSGPLAIWDGASTWSSPARSSTLASFVLSAPAQDGSILSTELLSPLSQGAHTSTTSSVYTCRRAEQQPLNRLC